MSKARLDTQAQMEAAFNHLSSAEPAMSGLVERVGPLHLSQTDDYFFTLVESICSQQLSSKVADTIIGRIRALASNKEHIEAEDILSIPDQALRDVGLSWSKVRYVKDLAQKVADGEVHLARIATMDDEEIVRELTLVKGIGRWTAEMFLMFSLARPDVFAVGDYGLQVGLKRLYDLPDLPKSAQMRELAEPWRPYRSYASLYLWRAITGDADDRWAGEIQATSKE
ncbi:MAG: DNA-3-methyladenine glycosylase [Chloroflexia bacterium]